MNKVICDICGTSYPETATQCPICGWAQADENQSAETVMPEQVDEHAFVKGGKYSKANVRKKSSGGSVTVNVVREKKKKKQPKRPENLGLMITAMILIFAIICVSIYIVIVMTRDTSTTVQPTTVGEVQEETVTEQEEQADTEADQVETKADAAAEQEQPTESEEITFSLKKDSVELKEKGDSDIVGITTNAETMETCKVVSKDDKIAKVELSSNAVVVTAVAEGATEIELLYNDEVVATCKVTCQFAKASDAPINVTQNSSSNTGSDTSTGNAELDQSVLGGTGGVTADG